VQSALSHSSQRSVSDKESHSLHLVSPTGDNGYLQSTVTISIDCNDSDDQCHE
jgi:hypothetical protein